MLLIFVLAVAVRMAASLLLGTYTDLSRLEMERAALSLAHSGRLADPYMIPTGYTAHVAPGYALLSSILPFGTGYAAELIKELVSCSAIGALYALLPLAAPAFGLDRRVGLQPAFSALCARLSTPPK